MALEQKLQDKIIKYLRSEGAYVVKVVTATRAGVPDITMCLKGRYIAIEVKSPTGTLSELQKVNLEKIRAAGGIAIVARDLETVKKLVNSLSN